jgi:hypothetical protein
MPTGGVSSRPYAKHRQPVSEKIEKWDSGGDPVPKLVDWARSKWGDGGQALPSRYELLRVFREQFGRVLGINEKVMRELRRQLAPPTIIAFPRGGRRPVFRALPASPQAGIRGY